MRLDQFRSGEAQRSGERIGACAVTSETDRLTDVLLCPPDYLSAVPCCSVTREAVRHGFSVSNFEAVRQHRALEHSLVRNGVRCHRVDPDPDHPDMCFVRDALVTTPWGVLGLNLAAPHRRDEPARLRRWLEDRGATIAGWIDSGHAEGGDIAVVREGLVVIGCSGERTDDKGADAVASLFRGKGWEAIVQPFDPHFLHLDTLFAMADDNLALACHEVLDDDFLAAVHARGIETIAVTYKEQRRLGCNIVSLGGGRVLSSTGSPRVNEALRARGLTVDTLDIGQFALCGGGVHCLTMPLARG